MKAEYSAEGPRAWIRFWFFNILVYPLKKKDKAKKKKPKPKKPKKPAKKKEEPKKDSKESSESSLTEKVGGALDYAQHLLPIVLDAGKSFYKKLQMDTLELELIVGDPDPADAAMRYGQASAILGAMWYPLTQTFHVKDGTARTRLDFDAREMTVFAAATLTMKIGQILWLGLYFGIRALSTFLCVRSRRKKEKQQDRKAA